MVTATRTRRTAKAKPAPEPEPEVVEEEELEEPEEELEEDEVEELEEADEPVGKGKKAAVDRSKQGVTFGVVHIAEHLASKGISVSTRELRQLIRKMARDGSNRVDREIVAGNRARYDWPKGLQDPEVKAIIKALQGGELEADKKEKLDALKLRKEELNAAKKAAADEAEAAPAKKAPAKAAAKPAAKRTTRRPKVEPVVVEDDDEELDLDDED